MVEWIDLKTEALLDSLSYGRKTGEDLLGSLDSAVNGILSVPIKDSFVPISAHQLIRPMGDVGRYLLREGKTDVLADCLRGFWRAGEMPHYSFEILKTEGEVGRRDVLLSMNESKDPARFRVVSDMLNKTGINKIAEIAGRTRIGVDGQSAELEFLSEDRVLSVEPGDDLMAGIFVKIGAGIQASPGLVRLVCSNGLTRRFTDTGNKDLDVVLRPEMMDSAIQLTTWLKQQKGNRIGSIRELSCAFTNFFSAGFLNKFWKGWSERVELGDLTWYDVVADMTNSVNETLSHSRYRVLEVGEQLQEVKSKNCCPVCSGKIHE